MQINVLFFAQLREKTKQDSATMNVPKGVSVAEFLEMIFREYALPPELKSRVRIAVNASLVSSETKLNQGDQIAIMTPVAGG